MASAAGGEINEKTRNVAKRRGEENMTAWRHRRKAATSMASIVAAKMSASSENGGSNNGKKMKAWRRNESEEISM
jgi:hypothetical protein